MPQATATLAAPAPPVPAATPGVRPAAGSDFAPLLRTVKEQGLLQRRRGWYARGITVNLFALAAVITGMAMIGGSWWVLLLAPLLGRPVRPYRLLRP